MKDKPRFGLKSVAEDRSIIVVSDLHLGGKEDTDTAGRFGRFLDHISKDPIHISDPCRLMTGAESGDEAVRKRLFPPEKIILLGDILELWDSRNRDRNCAFLDAMLPFLKMRDMDCDVVYVAGNHDEDIAEFITSFDEDEKLLKEVRKKKEAITGGTGKQGTAESLSSDFNVLQSEDKYGKEVPECLKIKWGESSTLEICSRHYPTPRLEGGKLGVEAGGIHYAFIHGQQFDKQQITYTISRALRKRFDPVDFLQDLACTSVAKRMNKTKSFIVILIAAALIGLYLTQVSTLALKAVGIITVVVLVAAFIKGLYLFGIAERDLPSSPAMAKICAFSSIALIAVLLFGWFLDFEPYVFQLLFWIPLLASLYILFVITIPVLFAWSKRTVYDKLWSSRKNKKLVDKMFDASKYQYESPVLVFGHTHEADFRTDEKVKKVKLLVNTGCWVQECDKVETTDRDTFAYIDKSGICCLRWNDDKHRIECYCKEIKGKMVPLCSYIKERNINLRE